MLKKLVDIFAGLPMTVVSGASLLLSLFLPAAGVVLPVDPAWTAVIISGFPLLYLSLWRVVYNKGVSKISSALLITIAMFAAIAIGDLFAAGEVAFIMSIGAILEDRTVDRAKKGLKKLISLAPVQARRMENGNETMIQTDEIKIGDRLRVLPGEAIPADGKIIEGETSIDQSVMTGESLPVDKGPGEDVFCGTINRFGTIDITATKTSKDSSLQKLIFMVRDADKKQAPIQRIADKAASLLVPAALTVAMITGAATDDIVRAVTVLVVFCPCALVLATPTAVMAAIGQAAKHGVVIKSGEALEKMGYVDTIAFDKTGTLTYGRLEVSDIISFDEKLSADELLLLVVSAEAKSEHPLGRAITEHAGKRNIPIIESTDFKMTPGRGISAESGGKKLFCGNEKYLAENGVGIGEKERIALEHLRGEGKASVLIACEGKAIGVVALSDALREDAAAMVSKLKAMGTNVVLLTGDNRRTAAYFAELTGITEVRAELLPEEKVTSVEELKRNGHKVCMIGDGVNDAPALKTADVSAAMGSMGSDIAIDAADIALMGDDISKIPYLKRLSAATVKTIKFSIALSMCINFAAVACSVAGILTPTTGALVHNAGSCFVVLIAGLLYDRKFE